MNQNILTAAIRRILRFNRGAALHPIERLIEAGLVATHVPEVRP